MPVQLVLPSMLQAGSMLSDPGVVRSSRRIARSTRGPERGLEAPTCVSPVCTNPPAQLVPVVKVASPDALKFPPPAPVYVNATLPRPGPADSQPTREPRSAMDT